MSKISLYKSSTDTIGSESTLDEYLGAIKSGVWATEVNPVRAAIDKKQRDLLKKNLHAVTPSGLFERRAKDGLKLHSGIICIDIDNHIDCAGYLAQDPYVYAFHLSVSGLGIAAYFKINPAQHEACFDSISAYLFQHYKIVADKACRDVSRLRYVSFDPYLYHNPLANVWELNEYFGSDIETLVQACEAKGANLMHENHLDQMRIAFAIASECGTSGWDHFYRLCRVSPKYSGYPIEELQRRYRNACNGKRNDIGIGTLFYVAKQQGVSVQRKQFTSMMRTYRHLKQQGHEEVSLMPTLAASFPGVSEATLQRIIERDKQQLETLTRSEKFWFVANPEKNNQKLMLSEADLFMNYLPTFGFKRFALKKEAGLYTVIRVENNQVQAYTFADLRKFFSDQVELLPFHLEHGYNRYDLLELLLKSSRALFDMAKLEFLPEPHLNFLSDDRNTIRIAYRNGIVELRSTGATLLPWTASKYLVWRSHVIDRDAFPNELASMGDVGRDGGDFSQFLFAAMGQDVNRFKAALSAFGYLMHRYKDRTRAWAIVLQDESMGRQQAGGTGKGLFMQALQQVRKVVVEDGKSFAPEKSFALASIELDTDVVFIDDIAKGFQFEALFSKITEGVRVEKKYQNSYFLPYEKAPKFCLSTNHALRGSGSSHDRRKGGGEIEFSPFFHTGYTPADYLGRPLFQDWNAIDWKRFDLLCFAAAYIYLVEGIIQSPSIQRHENALKANTGSGFVEFMDEYLDGRIGQEIAKQDLLNAYIVQESLMKRPANQVWVHWLKMYASARGLKLEEKRIEKFAPWCWVFERKGA